jgi:hypothetical protein
MEAIKQQISELQTAWAEAYTAMRANPTAWQPHLPGFFAEQIDEVVSTISLWLGKVDPPDGFKPAFHLAQGLVTTSLPQLLTTVKSLQKGEYNYLPSFVNGLNQILSALHSMVVYSSKYDAKHIAADLAAQLAESLSLLGTAQGELKKKADLLNASSVLAKDTEKRATAINDLQEKAAKLLEDTTKSFEKIGSDTKFQTTKILGDANADVIKLTAALEATATRTSADMQAKVTQLNAETEKKAATLFDSLTTKVTQVNTETEKKAATLIDSLTTKTTQTVEEIESFHTTAKKTSDDISADAKTCAGLKVQIEALLQKNAGLNTALGEQSQKLEQIQQKSLEQQKLITELVPEAASTGLAAGFEARAKSLQSIKFIWMAIFIVSICGLLGISIWLSFLTSNKEGSELWKTVLERLPFAAPLVWLGWFSAIQYGNTIRVQEDYAFKAATSKAFAGYKDHMEYMANVKLDEANNAMKLLAARTIEILAHEPLRIYQKTDKDASPASSILSLLGKNKPNEKDE